MKKIQNKMREEFEIVAKQKSYDLRRVSYAPDDYSNNGVQAMWVGYQAGRNHPIEVSLEEAAKVIYDSCTEDKPAPLDGFMERPFKEGIRLEDIAKAVLSLVPDCVVKE